MNSVIVANECKILKRRKNIKTNATLPKSIPNDGMNNVRDGIEYSFNDKLTIFERIGLNSPSGGDLFRLTYEMFDSCQNEATDAGVRAYMQPHPLHTTFNVI